MSNSRVPCRSRRLPAKGQVLGCPLCAMTAICKLRERDTVANRRIDGHGSRARRSLSPGIGERRTTTEGFPLSGKNFPRPRKKFTRRLHVAKVLALGDGGKNPQGNTELI